MDLRRNRRWFDTGTENSDFWRMQMFGDCLRHLAQAGVVVVEK
jgi:hypothetical protein